MNHFDKSVNILLENLIFEQDQNEIDPSQVIKQTVSEIEKRFDEDKKSYMDESKAKYMASQGFEEEVKKYIRSLSQEELSEQTTGLQSAWQSMKDAGSSALGWASSKFGPSLYEFGEAASEKIGDYVTSFIGKEYVDEINNNLSESIWYKIAAVLEPTGVMSWPYYDEALKKYNENKGTENEDIYFLNLLAAQISVIPGVRLPLGILTAPFKLLTGVIKLPFSIPRRIASFVRGSISKSPSAAKAAAKLESKGLSKAASSIKKITRPVSTRIKTAAKIGATGAKKAAKIGATGAKTAAVVSSGDIPQTWKDWSEAGKKSLEDAKPAERTLGKFPSFGQLSTQRL
jgi:hypothetical protein